MLPFIHIFIISQNKDVFIKFKWSLSMISSNDLQSLCPRC